MSMANHNMDDNDSLDEKLIVERPENRRLSKLKYVVFFAFIFILLAGFFAIGFLVGRHDREKSHPMHSSKENVTKFHKMILAEMKSSSIKIYLRNLTEKSHVAGSQRNRDLASFIFEKWKHYGLDKVEQKRYDVTLSYPSRPGVVTLFDSNSNGTLYRSLLRESRLWSDEEQLKDVFPPYNAYSRKGVVTGKLVYANHGTFNDFLYLEKQNISCTGKIVIVRYGKGFRANKVELAIKAGAIGMIIYSDPHDYSLGAKKYPNSWWLPSDGVQRGTILPVNGDPVTHGYPAVDGMFREDMRNLSFVPSIPVHPLSFQDAYHFLSCLDGEKAPRKWQGGLNISYRINMKQNNTRMVKLNISTEDAPLQPIVNVIGTIVGSHEPGAVDPSSGTAVLLEIARSLGHMLTKGWRPRRTIMLCSWDAEEFGLIGSTEWLEVSDPDEPKKSVYDTWKHKTPSKRHSNEPRVNLPGSGSDFKPFYCRLGIPVAALTYVFDWNQVGHVYSYPVYHSIHDSFHWMKEFGGDTNFTHHLALGRVWTQTMLSIADSTLLPFNFTRYGNNVMHCVEKARSKFGMFLSTHNVTLDGLVEAAREFTNTAATFKLRVSQLNDSDYFNLRIANDQMMRVERSFLYPQGQPQRPFNRHMIYSPSSYDEYTGQCFPLLTDAVTSLKLNLTNDWQNVKRQLSLAIYYLKQGTQALQ